MSRNFSRFRQCLCWILLLFSVLEAQAQETEWIHPFDSTGANKGVTTVNNADEIVQAFGVFTKNAALANPLNYYYADSFALRLVSMNPDGTENWTRTWDGDSGSYFEPIAITTDDNRNIYLSGIIQGRYNLGPSLYVNCGDTNRYWNILIKFNPEGNPLNYRLISFPGPGYYYKFYHALFKKNLHYANGKLISFFNFRDSLYLDYQPVHTLRDPFGLNVNGGLLVLDSSLNNINHLNVITSQSNGNPAGSFYDPVSTHLFCTIAFEANVPFSYALGKTISEKQGILEMDLSGNILSFTRLSASLMGAGNLFRIGSDRKWLLATDFWDTLYVGNAKHTSLEPGGIYRHGYALLKYNPVADSIEWLIPGHHAIAYSALWNLEFMEELHNEIYFCFNSWASYNTKWQSFGGVMLDTGYLTNMHYLVKIDANGNFLWFFHNSPARSIHTDSKKAIYLAGNYTPDKVILFNDSAINASSNQFLAKLKQYEIYRGNVHPGPYCAGDTIKVPFRSVGNFDSTNYYIAELSDENGDFGSGVRELGRLKSPLASDTIRGIVPMFNVLSSGNYRIRVRATNPQVFNFYRADTLKLLVYSKDSANAGPDDTICSGTSYRLSTSGGTRWQWSPGQYLSDSTSRTPVAFPPSTTTFRIIISDSSGCGDTDTDYVTVFVREPLRAKRSVWDTLLCNNQNITVDMGLEGGNPTKYHYRWFRYENGIPALVGKDSVYTIVSDTTALNRMRTEGFSFRGYGIWGDSCSAQSDTVWVSIKHRLPVPVCVSSLGRCMKDTVLCQGQNLGLKALYTADTAFHPQFQWLAENGTLLSSSDSLFLSSGTTRRYRLVTSEACFGVQDTARFTVYLNPPLRARILLGFNPPSGELHDTLLCRGSQLPLKVYGSGGDSINYTFEWRYNGNWFSNSDTIRFAPADTGMLQLKITDNCTLLSDSVRIRIGLTDSLKLEFQPPAEMCQGSQAWVKASMTGGLGKLRCEWYLDTVSLGISDSLQLNAPTRPGMHYLKGILRDDCNSPRSIYEDSFRVLEPLSVTMSSDSAHCFFTGVWLTAHARGGKPGQYQYRWMEGAFTTDSTFFYPALNRLYIRVTIKDNCSQDSTLDSIALYPAPRALFTLNADPSCLPQRAILTVKTDTENSVTWYPGDGSSYVFKNSAQHFFSAPGKYRGRLVISSPRNCTVTYALAEVEVPEMPRAAFRYSPQKPRIQVQPVNFTETGYGAVKWEWWLNDTLFSREQHPSLVLKDTGYFTVRLVIFNQLGCSDTISQLIYSAERFTYFLPNSFSPDGNNLNELFAPVVTGDQYFEMSIYDRWGALVWSGKDTGWDGTRSGIPVSEGVYIYTLRIRSLEGPEVYLTGTLHLLR